MQFLEAVFRFVFTVLAGTVGHLFWLLGLVLVFGLLLYCVARLTRSIGVSCAGQRWDVCITGWCGTPVHELGHAVFCLLFCHKITRIKLFDPDPKGGSLGYVQHSYDQHSVYQRAGNFFIGIGPVLLGSAVLYVLLLLFMPEWGNLVPSARGVRGGADLSTLDGWFGAFELVWRSVSALLGHLLDLNNLLNWRFWVFLYLSLCIASHTELSPPDIHGARDGLVTIALVLLVVNLVGALIHVVGLGGVLEDLWRFLHLDAAGNALGTALATLGALLAFALVVSLLNLALTYVGFTLWCKIRRRPGPRIAWN
ncbi:MAG: hypothetical protein LBR07_09290 [Puniceicoccales bacterium]|jgi:hypothetical protein|nr:hypothetical protein [Puniceicoccales bacterium]